MDPADFTKLAPGQVVVVVGMDGVARQYIVTAKPFDDGREVQYLLLPDPANEGDE